MEFNNIQNVDTSVVSTDGILISKNGLTKKATVNDLPVSAATQNSLDQKAGGQYDSDGTLIALTNKNGIATSIRNIQKPFNTQLPEPYLLESFNSTLGFTFATNSTNNQAVSGYLQTQGNGTAATLLATKTLNGPYNVSGMNTIAYLVNRDLNTVSSVSGAQFVISRSGTSVTKNLNDLASKFRSGKRWLALSVNDPELASIKALSYGSITVSPRVNQASPYTALVSFDHLYANAKGRPQFVITFDDATNTIINTVLPLMKTRGFRGTAFIPKNSIGTTNKLTLANLNTLYAEGWDLGSNTTTDASITSFATPTDAANNLLENMDYLYQNGFERGVPYMALSNGVWRDTGGGETYISALQAAGIKMARTTEPEGIYTRFGFADTAMTIPSKGFSSSTTLQSAKDLVDRAMLIGQTQWFHFHDIADTPSAIGWQTSNFIALLDYIKSFVDSNQADVLTASEFYSITSNASIPSDTIISV